MRMNAIQNVHRVHCPGLIGNKSEPGGTIDYAVDMLRVAANGKSFTWPIGPDARFPMKYMNDAVKAAIDLMDADPGRFRIRTSYNVAAMSFSPEELHGQSAHIETDSKSHTTRMREMLLRRAGLTALMIPGPAWTGTGSTATILPVWSARF